MCAVCSQYETGLFAYEMHACNLRLSACMHAFENVIGLEKTVEVHTFPKLILLSFRDRSMS